MKAAVENIDSIAVMSKHLSLEEVLQLVQDGEDPPEEMSDDGEDLVGDFVSASGRPMLFSDAMGDDGVDDEEYMGLSRAEPCFRSSLLLLDQSLTEVNCLRPSLVAVYAL